MSYFSAAPSSELMELTLSDLAKGELDAVSCGGDPVGGSLRTARSN